MDDSSEPDPLIQLVQAAGQIKTLAAWNVVAACAEFGLDSWLRNLFKSAPSLCLVKAIASTFRVFRHPEVKSPFQ